MSPGLLARRAGGAPQSAAGPPPLDPPEPPELSKPPELAELELLAPEPDPDPELPLDGPLLDPLATPLLEPELLPELLLAAMPPLEPEPASLWQSVHAPKPLPSEAQTWTPSPPAGHEHVVCAPGTHAAVFTAPVPVQRTSAAAAARTSHAAPRNLTGIPSSRECDHRRRPADAADLSRRPARRYPRRGWSCVGVRRGFWPRRG
jgi:hypothetical protein